MAQQYASAEVPARRDRLYVVKATPWDHGYELDILGVAVTQTHDEYPADAETMVRDCLAAMFERPADSFRIRIDYGV